MGVAARKITAANRFYDALAYKPWCGDDKAARLVRPKDSAIRKPYIAPNPPAMIHWLVFDIDHQNTMIWEDKNLPTPNLIVRNPSNGRSHFYYAISPVCTSENGRSGPIRFMEAVSRGLAAALEADEAYTGRISKNPLSEHWSTLELHANEYSLGELADSVEPIFSSFKPVLVKDDAAGRNVSLFHELRLWAYTSISSYKGQGESQWHDAVLNQALNLATIEVDFTYNEIKNTAKSVSRWVWTKYDVSHKNRGAMSLTSLHMPLAKKQRLAARRTHELRSNATEKAVVNAIAKLSKGGSLPSKAAVARFVGLSRQQISRRYAHLFTIKPKTPEKQDALKTKPVTFGVHQITAALRGPSVLLCEPLDIVECLDEGD